MGVTKTSKFVTSNEKNKLRQKNSIASYKNENYKAIQNIPK